MLNYVTDSMSALCTGLCKKFEEKGFASATFVPDREAAKDAILNLIPDGCSVGIPGTVTARQLNILEALENRGNKVYHHWIPGLEKPQAAARLAEENASDWFITGTNAVTIDGTLVNIDGTGNRVACMAWGRGKIIYVFGVNKIADNLESAIARARNFATPPNALRVGADVPCTKTGYCVNCNSPSRVCRVLTIIERAPFGRESHVIVVNEQLGY